MPSVPGSTSTGSAVIPSPRCSASEAWPSSRLASRRPVRGSAACRSSCSAIPASAAYQAPSSTAAQSCWWPPKGTITARPGRRRTALCARHERNVARRPREQRREVIRGHAPVEQRLGRVEQQQRHVLLGGEPHGVGARVGRGEGGHPGGHAALRRGRAHVVQARPALGQLPVVGHERGDHQLVVAASGEVRRELDERVRGVLLGQDEDGARRRGAGPPVDHQALVLREDPSLELVQLRAGLEADLVDQPGARGAVGLQRVRLTAVAVEREHELTAQPLAQRMLAHQRLQLTGEARVLAERELRLDAQLDRRQPQLVQADDRALARTARS